MTAVDSVGVIGGGVMGGGIGQALLQAGYGVTIHDVAQDAIDETRERIVTGNYGLERAIAEGYLTEAEKANAMDRVTFTLDLEEAVEAADIVVEAVPEDLSTKGRVFRRLDKMTNDVPLYSNTSGLSITAIANAVEDPSRVAGLHFFNPAPVMDLVEIVRTPDTDPAVVDCGRTLVADLGKEFIVIDDAPDSYGFVANRAFGALRREAQRIVDEGVATEEQVNTALKEGYNHPVGPFEFAGIGEEWD